MLTTQPPPDPPPGTVGARSAEGPSPAGNGGMGPSGLDQNTGRVWMELDAYLEWWALRLENGGQPGPALVKALRDAAERLEFLQQRLCDED